MCRRGINKSTVAVVRSQALHQEAEPEHTVLVASVDSSDNFLFVPRDLILCIKLFEELMVAHAPLPHVRTIPSGATC